jgi:predicted RND superfamily exporter protein
LAGYSTSQDLLEKIRTGKGDPAIYGVNESLYIENFLGGTLSETRDPKIFQDADSGVNDVRQAKATIYTYFVDMTRNPSFDSSLYGAWEEKLHEATDQFSEQSSYIRVEILTSKGIEDVYSKDLKSDMNLIPLAISVVGLYIMTMLGSCSPIHCRVLVGFGGVLTIMLAYCAGFGTMFHLEGQVGVIHQMIPFLLAGIGADDIFIIANAIDQTPFFKPVEERIENAMKRAGPTITITATSVVLAFCIGSITSLIALRSFCLFSGVCMFMLYFCMMTVFLSLMVWDT